MPASYEKAVCPSVKRVDCDKKEERFEQIFIPYKRSFSIVFRKEEWLMGRPLLHEILAKDDPRWGEIADFQEVAYGFRLIPTSVALKKGLNDLERRNSPCFALFHRFR